MDDKEWCCVCWEGYNKGSADQLVGQIKKCGHYFHFDCLWTWLESKRSCPLCRESADLTEEDIIGIPLKVLVKDNVLAKVNANLDATQPSDSGKVNDSENEAPTSSDSSLEIETTPPGESPGSDSMESGDVVDETATRGDESTVQNLPQLVSGTVEAGRLTVTIVTTPHVGTDNSGFVSE